MSLEWSMSLKKLIFVSLTEDDRSESLMAFSEDLTGQLWKEKGTQRCLCQKYYLIPEQPLDWPLLHSLEIVLGSEYICPLIHSLLPLMICLPILRGSVFQTVMPFLYLFRYDSKQNCA